MPIPWITAFTESSIYISKDELKAHNLTQDYISKINQQIISPFGLSASKIKQELFDSKLPDSDLYDGYFIFEAALSSTEIEDKSELDSLCNFMSTSLDIQNTKWDWLGSQNDDYNDFALRYYYKLRILRILLTKLVIDSDLTNLVQILLTSLSYHINPNTPWSSEINSLITIDCIDSSSELRNIARDYSMSFIENSLKPNLLSLLNENSNDKSLANSKLSAAGYANKSKSLNKSKGIRPQLGFSSINENITEENQRKNWKNSNKVKSISMIWYLISISPENASFDRFWPLITSFILNILDDYEPVMKAQGCKLLDHFIFTIPVIDQSKTHLFVKTGLKDLFTEAIKICLSYLPLITPANISLYLLSSAYPVIYKLIQIGGSPLTTSRQFIELINENILGSISHIQGRNDDDVLIDLHLFLLEQLGVITQNYLKHEILISFSRINFLLNQTITNIFNLDKAKGVDLITASVNVQSIILQEFEHLKDTEASSLVLSYKYDFLAAWVILLKRLSKTSYSWDNISKMIKLNTNTLESLAKQINENEAETFDQDLILINGSNLQGSDISIL